jgi:hypothetical protein
MIGHGLSSIRNGAITLLRQPDDRCIPDARRAMAAKPALAFALLGGYDENFEKPYRPPRRLTRRRRCGIISMDGAGAPPTIRRRILKLIFYYSYAQYRLFT